MVLGSVLLLSFGCQGKEYVVIKAKIKLVVHCNRAICQENKYLSHYGLKLEVICLRLCCFLVVLFIFWLHFQPLLSVREGSSDPRGHKDWAKLPRLHFRSLKPLERTLWGRHYGVQAEVTLLGRIKNSSTLIHGQVLNQCERGYNWSEVRRRPTGGGNKADMSEAVSHCVVKGCGVWDMLKMAARVLPYRQVTRTMHADLLVTKRLNQFCLKKCYENLWNDTVTPLSAYECTFKTTVTDLDINT